MGYTKKKRFDRDLTKCMQSRINLKFPEFTQTVSIKELKLQEQRELFYKTEAAAVDEFNKRFQEYSNHDFQRKKNTNVSDQSPFNRYVPLPNQWGVEDAS